MWFKFITQSIFFVIVNNVIFITFQMVFGSYHSLDSFLNDDRYNHRTGIIFLISLIITYLIFMLAFKKNNDAVFSLEKAGFSLSFRRFLAIVMIAFGYTLANMPFAEFKYIYNQMVLANPIDRNYEFKGFYIQLN